VFSLITNYINSWDYSKKYKKNSISNLVCIFIEYDSLAFLYFSLNWVFIFIFLNRNQCGLILLISVNTNFFYCFLPSPSSIFLHHLQGITTPRFILLNITKNNLKYLVRISHKANNQRTANKHIQFQPKFEQQSINHINPKREKGEKEKKMVEKRIWNEKKKKGWWKMEDGEEKEKWKWRKRGENDEKGCIIILILI